MSDCLSGTNKIVQIMAAPGWRCVFCYGDGKTDIRPLACWGLSADGTVVAMNNDSCDSQYVFPITEHETQFCGLLDPDDPDDVADTLVASWKKSRQKIEAIKADNRTPHKQST